VKCAFTDANDYSTALRNTGISVASAAAFGAGVWTQMGPEAGLSWFTGYILEESLSVDNLFVFILLFQYFKVPKSGQDKALSWGIIGAVIMRGLFIGAGLFKPWKKPRKRNIKHPKANQGFVQTLEETQKKKHRTPQGAVAVSNGTCISSGFHPKP
jgi:hypothetical protein